MHNPFIVTVGAILFWAALSAVSRLLLTQLNFDPWSFSFIQLLAGGGALLGLSGRASFGAVSFARVSTWVLGALRVLSAALYTSVLALVSVLEAGIIGAMSTPLIAVAAFIFSRRAPTRGEWPGYLLIFLCIFLLATDLSSGMRNTALGFMFLNAICLIAMNLLAEKHPDNLSDDPAIRLAFTGTVLLVTAGLFSLIYVLQSDVTAGELNWDLLIAGILVGIFLRAPSMLLTFSSIRLVGAQNYTVAMAFLPLIGMTIEELFLWTGLIDVSRFKFIYFLLGLGIVMGTIIILVARIQKK